MPRFRSHQNVWRGALILILVVSILGPWTHTSDGVPPPEWCETPLILLETGRCARLMPGIEIMSFAGSVLMGLRAGLGTGELTWLDLVRDLLFSLLMSLLILPLLFLMVQLRFRDNRSLQVLAIAIYTLAAGVWLYFGYTESVLPPGQVWGLWLFISTAVGALAMEAALFRAGYR